MQRLGAAEDGGHGLQCDPGDVVHGLLRRQRHACGLSVEAKQPTALVFRFEPVFHYLIPDLACGAVLGDFFEEVIVGVEEKAEPWTEVIYVEPSSLRPLDVLDAVIQSESQFLQGSGTCFADVISADRNGVEFWGEF